MRIVNLTTNNLTLTDIDRGLEVYTSIYESWNAKADNGIPASGLIDILDTERVLLSDAMGQINKFRVAGKIATYYSITGRTVGPFEITGINNTFKVQVGTDPVQSITLPSGSSISMSQIVSAITLTATGFTAEISNRFFRSSNTDIVTGKPLDLEEGPIGYAYGPRAPSLISGFLVLWGNSKITIGTGNANSTLGFYDNESTLAS